MRRLELLELFELLIPVKIVRFEFVLLLPLRFLFPVVFLLKAVAARRGGADPGRTNGDGDEDSMGFSGGGTLYNC